MTIGRTARATSVVLMLALLPATAAAQQQAARKAAPDLERAGTPASMGVHGFSVVLVVGHSQGSIVNESVPEAARKALADMKDFLPYKRYQLLDAAWILCCGSVNNGVSGRVRGPDGRDYQYILDPSGVVGSKLNLRFTMREVHNSLASSIDVDKMSDSARLEHMRQQAEAARELDEAELQVRTLRPRVEVGTANTTELESANMRLHRAQQRVQDLQRIVSSGQNRSTATASAGGRGGGGTRGGTTFARDIMDSSFSISLGETVVIGTSRLSGDQALIALLTAAAKPGTAR